MKSKEEQAEIIQSLFDTCNDSRKGYEQAADSANGKSLKLYLHNIALERKDFGRTLAGLVELKGGSPAKGGTFKGALHRNWLNVKAAVAAETEESLLEEVLYGEKRLIEDYIETVKEGEFDQNVRGILARQLGNVQERVHRMEKLKEGIS